MLLPQGEFAKFLRCGDDDRRMVLSRLFGTQLYDQITGELDRRRQAAAQRREQARKQIDGAVSAAAEAAGRDGEARDEVVALDGAERGVRLKEIAAELAKTAEVTGAGLAVAETATAAALRAGEQAKRQAGLMTRLTQALARLREHEGTRAAHEQRAGQLALARQADPVRPLLAALADAEAAADAARNAVLGLVAGWDEDMPAGRDGDAPAEPAAAAAAAAAGRADAAEQAAISVQHLADAEAALPGRDAAMAALAAAAGQASARAAALAEARRELPAAIDGLERELAAARDTASQLAAARARQELVAAQHAAAARLAELGPLLAAAAAVLRDAVDAHQARVDAHQQRAEARLAGMAAELAAQLADGAACPVCGSADHPAPAPAGDDASSAEDVADAAARRDAALGAREQAAADRDELAREEAALLAAAGGRTIADLAAEADALAATITAAEAATRAAGPLAQQLADRRAEHEQAGQELLTATAEATAAAAQLLAARADRDQLSAQIAAGAAGYPTVAARQRALRSAAERDRALAAALDRLAAAGAAELQARSRAEREAQANGFAALDDARPAVLDSVSLAELGDLVASWEQTLIRLTADAEADDLAGLDPDLAPDVQAAARAAADALARAEEAEREVRAGHGAATAMVTRFGQRLDEVRGAEESCDRLVERTETVIRLANLAKGMDGHRRVTLTTYVLRHWFEQVVAAANVRLSVMSSGRYELRRIDEGENKRQRAGPDAVGDRPAYRRGAQPQVAVRRRDVLHLAGAGARPGRRGQGRGRGSGSGHAVHRRGVRLAGLRHAGPGHGRH